MSLEAIIINRIRTQGPISFHDFMEMALYYPGLGYYTSGKQRIGKNGDYYTSPLLSGLFATMIARQLEEMWCRLGETDFTVLEYGAGNGALCRGILDHLQQTSPLYEKLTYLIMERNGSPNAWQQPLHGEKVKCCSNAAGIPAFNGCILSNELIDNFPVHKVVMEDELMEVFVDYNGHGFVELLWPAQDQLKAYFTEQQVLLPKGYCTEINMRAIEWMNDISGLLNTGFVLTMDYGFAADELYSLKRSAGTIICYHKHAVGTYPYVHIGEQDITTHVNFSALYHSGLKAGLRCLGFSDQASFLHGLGVVNELRSIEQHETYLPAYRDQLLEVYRSLINMSKKIKVLIQYKNVGHPALAGMQFAAGFV